MSILFYTMIHVPYDIYVYIFNGMRMFPPIGRCLLTSGDHRTELGQEDGYRIMMSVIDSGRISEFVSEDVPYRESEYRYFSMPKYTNMSG